MKEIYSLKITNKKMITFYYPQSAISISLQFLLDVRIVISAFPTCIFIFFYSL